MARQKIKTRYHGRYQSSTFNAVNQQDIVVNAARFTPIDLLASAYNSCMLGTMDAVALQHGFSIGKATSEVAWALSTDGTRVGTMNVKIGFDQDLQEDQRALVEHAAQKLCHVGQSLNPAIERHFQFTYQVAVAA